MGIAALVLSAFITLLSPEIIFLPEQVLARTRPTFYDLLIALAAGSAGAYTITRKESSAIPGVAVAVALLPPLASAGVLLMTGEFELATRAIVLFLTNLIAMILAGALTFIAVGVSPASTRRRSAAFIKSKLWLFFILVMAVSIPLYFYSEKILFNAEYQAAKSETIQQWLKENELTLVDVDISVDDRTIFFGLEGPNPPVNIKQLHEGLSEKLRQIGETDPIRLEYTWTQKVKGAWPTTVSAIEDVAAEERASSRLLIANDWSWQFTQYDADRGSRPSGNHNYIVRFDDRGRIGVTADCGTVKGNYTTRGKSINIAMKKFNWFQCRKEAELELFLGDLKRGDAFYIADSQLQISLVTDSGIMYFDKYGK